jgi:Domain of unknown function (DUF5658)
MNRRNPPDRRRRPTPALSHYTLAGRRHDFRREEDKAKGGYVDRYDTALFFFLVTIIAFNLLDALLTHTILDFGGRELNPVAHAAIFSFGKQFWIWKHSIVSVLLVILCLHSKFPRVKIAIGAIALAYCSVVLYQVALLNGL